VRRAALSLLAICTLAISAAAPATGTVSGTPVDWVNTYIGTGGSSDGPDYGGTMPLVTTPFGMTNWTAQTRQNRISVSSYAYEDGTISGFIGTHQPAIWMGDYGYVTLMPETGNIKPTVEYRRLRR
jgi:putative alpha-1,2-mannosidase